MAELLCLAGSSTTQVAQSCCDDHSVALRNCATAAEVVDLIAAEPQHWLGLVLALGTNDQTSCWPILEKAREVAPQLFVAIYSHTAQADCKLRLQCFDAGARMVTSYPSALDSVIKLLVAERATVGSLSCAYCGVEGLSEDALHRHLDLFHTYERNIDAPCPICSQVTDPRLGGLAVHYHNNHGPPERREIHHPGRAPLAAFALVVCQRPSDGKFLMVQEPLGIGGGYWLPAGRVDPGETLVAGGLREVLEEAGVHVRITAVLRFSLTNALRVIFLATPVEGVDDTPKTIPDFESAGACWVSAEDVEMKLTPADCRGGRATEPLEWFPKVAAGERGCSLETEEYKALDAAVVALCNPTHQHDATDETATLDAMFFPRWEALQAVYPRELFCKAL